MVGRPRVVLVLAILAATFAAVAGCGLIAGVDFDEAHLVIEAGAGPLDDGGPTTGEGGPGTIAPGVVLDGGATSQCTPDPSSVTCAGKCGVVKDNCGADRACASDCGSGQACNGGACQCTAVADWCNHRCGSTADNCGTPTDCGKCAGTDPCVDNSCGCVPEPPTTTCGSKQCGTAVNNCGQTVNCGLGGQCATPGAICKADGSCCKDDGIACNGRCGGVTVKTSCGQDVGCPASCNAGQVCVGTSCCTPEPLATTCSGVACGPKTNNCGQTVNCPDTCASPQKCGGGGTGPNGCGCTTNPNACGNLCSGTAPDGCGGTVTCFLNCGLEGECPCRGGSCNATTHTCHCIAGPCF